MLTNAIILSDMQDDSMEPDYATIEDVAASQEKENINIEANIVKESQVLHIDGSEVVGTKGGLVGHISISQYVTRPT